MTKQFMTVFLATTASIMASGILLDEMGKGTFGDSIANVAKKVTNGFGV